MCNVIIDLARVISKAFSHERRKSIRATKHPADVRTGDAEIIHSPLSVSMLVSGDVSYRPQIPKQFK